MFTAWKVLKYGFFLIRIFPHFDWIRRDTPYLSVFSPNVGKDEPEKTPYLDTFHAVVFFNPSGTVTHKSKISYLILVHWIVNIWQTHILTEFNKSSSLQVLWKIGVLKNFAETPWKRDSNTGVLLWILRNF